MGGLPDRLCISMAALVFGYSRSLLARCGRAELLGDRTERGTPAPLLAIRREATARGDGAYGSTAHSQSGAIARADRPKYSSLLARQEEVLLSLLHR